MNAGQVQPNFSASNLDAESKRLRVLHVINRVASHGGAEVSLLLELPRLQALGLNNAVVSLYPYEDGGARDRLERAGVRVFDPIAGRGPAALRRLVDVIDRMRPDLVHTTLFDADLVGRLAALRCGVPVVTTLVNSQYEPEARPPGSAAWKLEVVRLADGLLARHATVALRAITAATADSARRRLGVRERQLRVVPRGRAREQLDRSGRPAERVRAELGLTEGAELILNVARQELQKGQRHLLAAFAGVAAQRPLSHLVLAGREGGATAALLDQVRALRLEHRVHLLGARDDVPDLLRACNVFAFSSLWEGLGGSVLEAMALAVPVVAFDIPPVREVLGGTGTLVPVGRETALATALAEALEDRSAARARAHRARERFDDVYELEVVCQAAANLYREAERRYRLRIGLSRLVRARAALDGMSMRALVRRATGSFLAPISEMEFYDVLAARSEDVARAKLSRTCLVREVPPGSVHVAGGAVLPGAPPRDTGLPRRRSRWFVAYRDEEPLGMACLELEHEAGSHRGWSPHLDGRAAVVSGLWVRPEQRATGAGAALVQAAAGAAVTEGRPLLLAQVKPENRGSQRLFRQRLDFRRAGASRVVRVRTRRFGSGSWLPPQ